MKYFFDTVFSMKFIIGLAVGMTSIVLLAWGSPVYVDTSNARMWESDLELKDRVIVIIGHNPKMEGWEVLRGPDVDNSYSIIIRTSEEKALEYRNKLREFLDTDAIYR